jgi:hypothetical protein
LLQTITARYDGGDTLPFRLEEGPVGLSSSGKPALFLEPNNKEKSTISFTAMSKSQLQLATIRWSRPPYALSPYPRGLTPDGIIICTHAHGVEAIVAFDDSLDDLPLESNIFAGDLNLYFHTMPFMVIWKTPTNQLPIITINVRVDLTPGQRTAM